MKKIILGLLIFFTFSISNCYSNSSDIALKDYFYKLKTDTSNIDNYLDSLIIAYPQDFRFSYQKAIALVRKDMIKPAYGILDSLVLSGVKDEMLYQLLINCYIQDNKVMKALAVADSSLIYFPNSAKLLLEYGYLQMELKKTIAAVTAWENGIAANPYYSLNYHPLISYYYEVKDKIWGLLYSEIFVNLTDNDKLASAVSQQAYNEFFAALPSASDSIPTFKYTNIIYTYIPGTIDTSNYLFEVATQLQIMHSYNYLKQLNPITPSLSNLHKLLLQFNKSWYKSIYSRNWNIAVFAFHKQLIENDLFEPYIYLIYKYGNIQEFEAYSQKNIKKLNKLIEFLTKNRIDLGDKYKVNKHSL